MTTETDGKAAAPRWMRFALLGSLAVNLAILGVVVGTLLLHRGSGPPPVLRDLSLGLYTEALAPEDRDALRQAFRSAAPVVHGLRRSQQEDQKRLLEALRAQPFDPDAVQDILAAQRLRMMQGAELGQRALVTRLGTMSDAARAAYADRLEELMSRPRRGPRGADGERRAEDPRVRER
ncbi:periplasmic heavy metal sensor [Plastorhodobacter daqingensis]|uniref:Periplasmic heavy metal sensor n=1 Tax=Plastorhodobacter daqingensis TaxID=1387281 RepID=A0ABW2UGH4_9RHOB